MDQVIKALAHQGNIRILVADSTELVKHAQKIHDTLPTATAALGRLLSVTAIMGSMLKNENDQITCSIRGDGPLIKTTAISTSKGQVKGYVREPHVHFINEQTKKLDVAKAIGKGTLEVIKDMGLKSNFTSMIDLISGEIGEDFANYFAISEQIPSAVSVGVLVNEDNTVSSAGAIIIQMMPGALEEDILAAEHVIKSLKPVSTIFNEKMTAKEVAKSLFDDVEILDMQPLTYECNCSLERIRSALALMDVIDLKDMLIEDKKAEIICQFCKLKYVFDEKELTKIIKEKVLFNENKRNKLTQ